MGLSKYSYSDNLESIIDSKSTEEQNSIYNKIDSYIEEYSNLKAAKGVGKTVLFFLQKTNEIIESSMEESQPSIACSSGCGTCCHIPVGVTSDEALVLAALYKGGHIQLNEELLVKQSETPYNKWYDLAAADRRCMFLNEEGSCSIYDYRPFACRKLLVVSPKENCTLDASLPITQFASLEIKILATALFTLNEYGVFANHFRTQLEKLQ